MQDICITKFAIQVLEDSLQNKQKILVTLRQLNWLTLSMNVLGFDNWERIQHNLLRCRLIDQKRLSVNQLNRTYDFAWCLNYEESIRQRTKKPDPPLYSDDKYEDIKQYIKQSGILEDVDYDPKCITAICSRLQRELVFNPR